DDGAPLPLNLSDGVLSIPYTLTYAAGAKGSISGNSPQHVHKGDSGSLVKAIPDTGYHFVKWSDDVMTAERTDGNVSAGLSVTATFAIDVHTLTYLAVNGSISGKASQTIEYGADGTSVTAVPNQDCYFLGWSDGLNTLTRKETNLTADATFTANFRTNVFTDASSIYNLTDKVGGEKIFVIKGLAGQKYLTVELKNVVGDCDLYLRHGLQPTVQMYNYRSTNGSGMPERITVLNPLDGDWYVMICARDDYSGTVLSVSYGIDGLDAPASLAATKGLYDKKVILTWDAVTGAKNYEIFRSDVSNIELATKINTADVTGTTYEDTFTVAGYYHSYYWVRAVADSGLKSEFAGPAEGETMQTGTIALKNGTAIVNIIGYEGSVKTYSINIPDTFQTLLEIKISGGSGNCDFDIVDPLRNIVKRVVGGSNYEFVQINRPAKGDWIIHLYGQTDYSGLSLLAKYSKQTAVPAAPVISATDGTYEDRVHVTWKAVPGATSYEIYRNTAVNATAGEDFKKIGEITDCIFEDNTAEYGITYFYFAKARNSIGPSVKYSAGNSGYVAKAPAVPGAITASDGTYFDKIRVSWAKVTGATSYLVFRTDTAAPAPLLSDTPLGETTALFLDDLGVDIAPPVDANGVLVVKKYYYWIAAKNANSTTVISKPNDGCLSKKGPATVTASNGTYSNRIVVTWTAVPGATAYDVWRYTDTKFTQNPTKVGNAVVSLEYEDSQATPNTPYYYKVKAKYGSGVPVVYKYDSAFSITGATGKASGSFTPTATPYVGSVENIANLLKSSAYYSVDVPVGTTRLVATLDGTNSTTLKNDCDLYAKFANFPTTASYNAKGVENKTNEILTVGNPSAGTWYFLLYGFTSYSGVTLTVNCYSVADIVLTQVPSNNLAVPFTATFKGKVVDGDSTGIPNIAVQVRNPITGLTSSLTKTDAKGIFSYSTPISTEGEHTFDFFFVEMPDTAKGTASHTVATRKGCLETNNYFDFSAYLPATPVPVPLQADIMGLQTFLDIRNGWNTKGTVSPGDTYETMWINSTLVKAGNDDQLTSKLDEGLYMYFYGVEGAGVGNDTTTASALSTVPFVVHVETSRKADVLTALKSAGIIDETQELAINGDCIGIIAVASLSSPDEATDGYNISLLAREQLEVLAILAGWDNGSTDVVGVKYSDVTAKQVTLTLSNGRKINIVAAGFVK
ncbi:MAG: pre-peptidase C-terminal domain-containing protein, partial [Victivallales bacterium]